MDISNVEVYAGKVKVLAVECTNIGFPRGLPEEELRSYVLKELDNLVKHVKDTVKESLDGALFIVCLENMDLSIESWEMVTYEYLSGPCSVGIRDLLVCQKEKNTDIKRIVDYAKNNKVCRRFFNVSRNPETFDYDPDIKESMMKEILLNMFKEYDLNEEEMALLLNNCRNLAEVIELLTNENQGKTL